MSVIRVRGRVRVRVRVRVIRVRDDALYELSDDGG